MAGILLQTGDEPVTLSAKAARRLLERGDGDAALLYLALLRHRGTVPPRSLAGELRWDRVRIEGAERTLRELELVSPAVPEEVQPPEEHPPYTRDDVALRLESSAEFRNLTTAVEQKLGKKLTTPDVSILLGLYDQLGLPADVIYTLVGHCAGRIAERYGPGRRPTLRQIEREGYVWARRGIDTQAAASEYLRTYARRHSELARYMQALRLGDRTPVASEEKYLEGWMEMGFPPETVALAYDRTVFQCHEFKWAYCNGILRRWHQAGLHTPTEVEGEHRTPAPARDRSDGGELRRYVQELNGGEGQ